MEAIFIIFFFADVIIEMQLTIFFIKVGEIIRTLKNYFIIQLS